MIIGLKNVFAMDQILFVDGTKLINTAASPGEHFFAVQLPACVFTSIVISYFPIIKIITFFNSSSDFWHRD